MDPRVEDELAALAQPLEDETVLDALMERIGDARIVMLGEATHGTSEFYSWRSHITMRLVREKGFRIVGVEGDWPDCFTLNRYVKADTDAPPGALEALDGFRRWPTWMWANHEVARLLEAMREHNAPLLGGQRVGFYGLDVYSLWDSMRRVVDHLEGIDADAAQIARDAWACFEPYGEDEQRYALATEAVPEDCREEVVRMLAHTRRSLPQLSSDLISEERLDAEQNAVVAMNAETYYRTMVEGGPISWNLRDTHMMDTLDRLLRHHGSDAKAVVWAHNTHVGDARATDMAPAGMTNIGQLARERHGLDDVVLVGFGTHRGSLIAGRAWGAPMQRMDLPPARRGSLEHALHELVGQDALLVFRDVAGLAEIALDRDPFMNPLAAGLLAPIPHRAVGVVYAPERERGHYVPTVLPLRYDAFLHIDRTHALRPLGLEARADQEPETFPWGV